MHKNNYTAKTLIGNWQEERSTIKFEDTNEEANTHLPNPSYNKFIPISKDIGDKKEYQKVSAIYPISHYFSNLLITPLRTG